MRTKLERSFRSWPALLLLLALLGAGIAPAVQAGAEAPVKGQLIQFKSPTRGLSSVIEDEPAWYSRPDAMPQPRVSRDVVRMAPPGPPRSSGNPLHYPAAWD